ncbi:MAG TPA: twin-arginine translocation signal domain-containing protein, partial [Candidatus Solibacter sp.]
MDTRRQFIQLSAAAAAVPLATAATPPMPTAKFGKHEISRLIIGSNPFYGYSHASRLLDQHMREWGTP